MNYVMSEDGSTPGDPVYICIAESQLNSVMKSLESAQGRCSRQSLAMVTAGHDLRQHIHIIRAALDHLESTETVFANQWIDTAKEQARRLEDEALHLVERFTPRSPDVIWYEVTIEDPNVFTKPWRIAMPLYRRVEPNMQLLEFRCNEFVEEFMYGNLRKQQLVKHWEGDTMAVDITRKIPPGDAFYEWYSR